jgi:hypothetical protein
VPARRRDSFQSRSSRHGIGKDSYLTIAAVNRAGNTLTLRNGNGERDRNEPARWDGVQAYSWEQRLLAAGDRLQFRIHDKKHKVANGEFAIITELDRKQVKLRFDDNRELALPFSQLSIRRGKTKMTRTSIGLSSRFHLTRKVRLPTGPTHSAL